MSMIKYPGIITNSTKVNKKFAFAVKERIGEYHVYDYDLDYGLFGYFKREFPKKIGKKEDIDMFMELTEFIGFKVRRVSDTEVWFVNPKFENYETVELPLYAKSNKNIRTIFSSLGTSYTVKDVPSRESIKKAWEYKAELENKVKEAIIISEIDITIEKSPDGVSCIVDNKYDLSEILDKDKYLVFHIRRAKSPEYYKTLIINKILAKENTKGGALNVIVPKEFAGFVIGKGGKNSKVMATELSLKRLNIISAE